MTTYRTSITYTQYSDSVDAAVERTYEHDSRRPLTYRGAQCLLTRIWREAGEQAAGCSKPIVTRLEVSSVS